MATQRDYQSLFDRVAALREQVANNLSADLVSNPQLADALTKQIDDLLASVVTADGGTPPPPDAGLSALAGVGPVRFVRFRRYAHSAGRHRLRRHDHVGTDHGGRRYVLSLAAREDRRLPRRAEAARAFPGGRGSAFGRQGRFRPLPVRSPSGAALYRQRPRRRLSPAVRLRRRLRRRPARGPIPISIPSSLISSSR